MWDDEEKPAVPGPPTWGTKRSERAIPAATLAEATLAKRLGWNLKAFRGQEAVDVSGGSGAYTLIAPNAVHQRRSNAFDVLRLDEWNQFGNAVRQLRNMFCVAKTYGARRLEFPRPHPFFGGDKVGPFDLAWRPRDASAAFPGLAGEFFFLGALGLKPRPDEQAEIVRRYVRPLLIPSLRQPNADIRDNDMVLHFRGDDVFGARGKDIHPDYGQPPLAYYLGAIEREKPSRVWLVYQDRSNPCVDAAETALRAKGVEVVTQSAALDTDLRILMSASCLVAGIGTFCPAAAALSTRVRKLYLFGSNIPTLQKLGIEVVEGRDTVGEYMRSVRSRNWTATPEQLALMLSYRSDAIEFMDHPPNS